MASELISPEVARRELARIIAQRKGISTRPIIMGLDLFETGTPDFWEVRVDGVSCAIFHVEPRSRTLPLDTFSQTVLSPIADIICGAAHVPRLDKLWQPVRGDVVWLCSGSPTLGVCGPPRPDGYVEVEWFAGDELRRDAIHIDSLRNFKPEPTTGANGRTFAENLAMGDLDRKSARRARLMELDRKAAEIGAPFRPSKYGEWNGD